MVVAAHSNSKDGYSKPLSALLHDYEPSMDDSVAKLLKAGIENGLIFNQPALCKLAGFYCPYGNPRVSHKGLEKPFTPLVRKALMEKVVSADEKALEFEKKDLKEAAARSAHEKALEQPFGVYAWLARSPDEKKAFEEAAARSAYEKSLEQPFGVYAWLTRSPNEKKAFEEAAARSAHEKALEQPFGVYAWLARSTDEKKAFEEAAASSAYEKSLEQPFGVYAWLTRSPNEKKAFEEAAARSAHEKALEQPFGVYAWLARSPDEKKAFEQALPHSGGEKVFEHEINIQEMKIVADMVFRLESLRVDASIRFPRLVLHDLPNKFLHPALRNVLAFSEKNLPQLLTSFALTPYSKFGNLMKLMLQDCNDKNIPSSIEIRKCSISSQEVMQAASSLLEDEIIACKAKTNSICNLKSLVASIHDTDEMVKISNVQLMANSSIICHPLQFPYTVFGCHKIVDTKLFQVTIEASRGRFMAPVACHMKTEGFVTSHPAFKVLNIKPGGGEICHWVRPGAMAIYV